MAIQCFYPFRSERAKAEYEACCLERAKAWPVMRNGRGPSHRTGDRQSQRKSSPRLLTAVGRSAEQRSFGRPGGE
jgi:hypothetical protein